MEDDADGNEQNQDEAVMKPRGFPPILDAFNLDVLNRIVHSLFDTGEVVSTDKWYGITTGLVILVLAKISQQTQNIRITCIKPRANVFDVGPTV